MKKISTIAILALIPLMLVGCGKQASHSKQAASETSSSSKKSDSAKKNSASESSSSADTTNEVNNDTEKNESSTQSDKQTTESNNSDAKSTSADSVTTKNNNQENNNQSKTTDTGATINFKGGSYNSIYTLDQMRQKFNLPSYDTKQSDTVTVHHNQYMGLVKGNNVASQAAGADQTQGNVNNADYYAAFFTYSSDQKTSEKKYVNLSDGSFYVQRFGTVK